MYPQCSDQIGSPVLVPVLLYLQFGQLLYMAGFILVSVVAFVHLWGEGSLLFGDTLSTYKLDYLCTSLCVCMCVCVWGGGGYF